MSIDLDRTTYPTRWVDYIGQETAKRQLQLAIASAKKRHAPLDHVFLTAPAGVGKTALALLVAEEMTRGSKRQVKVVSGMFTWVSAVMTFDDMNDGDVLVMDEFHKVFDGGVKHAEWLLHYLQDGTIVTARGTLELPKVTIVATTTELQKVPETILSRFPIRPVFEEYSLEQTAKIARVMSAGILVDLPPPSTQDCRTLAGAGAGNPRAIRRLLTTLRDLAVVGMVKPGKSGYGTSAISEVLAMHDVTEDGLDRLARRYLDLLVNEFAGRAGIRAITDRLGQNPAEAERTLMDRGLIVRTSGGREITAAGIRRVKQLRDAA